MPLGIDPMDVAGQCVHDEDATGIADGLDAYAARDQMRRCSWRHRPVHKPRSGKLRRQQ